MSGITPLIDTLLHQVLGRQGELSLQRALDQPVKPIHPGQGPRAVMGDANLDGRATTSPLSDLKRLPLPADGGRTLPRGEVPPSPQGSTQTHFSPAARTIADVLLRFPAPPSVMRPEAPLITSQETPTASAVATRLEASIRDSGLFYESHLKRWFQGEGTRQQLMNQPQMQPGPRSLASLLPISLSGAPPASASSTAAPQATAPQAAAPSATASSVGVSPTAPSAGPPAGLASAPLAPLAAPLVGQGGMSILPNVPLIPVTHEQGLTARLAGAPHSLATGSTATQAPAVASQVSSSPAQAGSAATPAEVRDGHQARAELSQAREVAELMANRPAREVVHESLQSLVRQQLEMLVMPTIRWEGDVWAGIFMALVINLPAREEGGEGKQQEGEQDGGWRSDMQLDVPNLGAFNASLWLYRNVLSIDFTTDSTEVYQRIDAGLPALEKRLSALDLQNVQLRARHIEAEAAYGNAG
ncbi:flagellar hook-length control protein FliK [Halomonas sp. SpR1]|uniref:flagellar hook-length control protein FliK n=1 Tax=Halomonas sp. SpR1 TaxID=3050462 RepID=UPI0027E3BC39|nr:flagellar hook-length control protein FliK [Halomonas sp. SpR1]MDQ7733170.1 flagellar hook-length control protein FliK [Halomonas sp. SpR1]